MKRVMSIVAILGIGLVVGAVVTFVLVHGRLPQRGEVRQQIQEKVAEVASSVEMLKKLHDEGYEANPLTLRKLQNGGQPMGRWSPSPPSNSRATFTHPNSIWMAIRWQWLACFGRGMACPPTQPF